MVRHTLQIPARPALSVTRPVIMGVLNVTPDSFSDGGRFDAVDAAVAQGLSLAEAGAALIDIGGESTRPGAERIDIDTQKARVLPVIERLRPALDKAGYEYVVLSIDTTRAAVAEAALDAGAAMLNDVSAGREDDALLPLAAARRAPIALMHMQGAPATMQRSPHYEDVVEDVLSFLRERVEAAAAAGIERSQVVIDPGIGFGKTAEHNLALLRHLHRFVATGQPVLVGASRKRFIQAVSDAGAETPDDRLGGTCAVTALAAAAGAAIIRVHDVAANRQAADVAWAIRGSDKPR
jgi:dihydropteroate synthase